MKKDETKLMREDEMRDQNTQLQEESRQIEDVRFNEERIQSIIANLHQENESLLTIKDEWKIPGMVYSWLAVSFLQSGDFSLTASARKGWRPVPANRNHGEKINYLYNNELSKQYIIKEDAVLCEREKEIDDAEKMIEKRKVDEAYRAVRSSNYTQQVTAEI